MVEILLMFVGLATLAVLLHTTRKVRCIMAKQSELATKIDALTEQVDKIGTETSASLAEIQNLKAIIAAGGEVSPELQAAVDRLETRIKAADDLVQDAPTGEDNGEPTG